MLGPEQLGLRKLFKDCHELVPKGGLFATAGIGRNMDPSWNNP
jgi:hypothetical protein